MVVKTFSNKASEIIIFGTRFIQFHQIQCLVNCLIAILYGLVAI